MVNLMVKAQVGNNISKQTSNNWKDNIASPPRANYEEDSRLCTCSCTTYAYKLKLWVIHTMAYSRGKFTLGLNLF